MHNQSNILEYYIRTEMWSPFCQFVMFPRPVFMPMRAVPTVSMQFPFLQSFSTFPSTANIDERETPNKNIHFEPECVSSVSQSQEKAEEKLKFASDMEDELLNIVKLLLDKIDSDTKVLQEEIKQKFSVVKVVGEQFFRSFISKLKKLTKTKEQIVKYCIRKAFKFVNQKIKEGSCVLDENDILKEFFKGMNENLGSNAPFKKDSVFKTMNSTFLTQLFSSQKFPSLYHEFLIFPQMCEADNLKKIENLAKMMHKHILTRSKDMKKFNTFKRIPWTDSVKSKCYKIASDLEQYADKTLTKKKLTTDQ